MIERILDFSIRHRWFVLLATLGLAVLGVFNYERLPIDAVPDITNVQVQIKPTRQASRRSKRNSASPSPSKPPWEACRIWITRVRLASMGCHK